MNYFIYSTLVIIRRIMKIIIILTVIPTIVGYLGCMKGNLDKAHQHLGKRANAIGTPYRK